MCFLCWLKCSPNTANRTFNETTYKKNHFALAEHIILTTNSNDDIWYILFIIIYLTCMSNGCMHEICSKCDFLTHQFCYLLAGEKACAKFKLVKLCTSYRIKQIIAGKLFMWILPILWKIWSHEFVNSQYGMLNVNIGVDCVQFSTSYILTKNTTTKSHNCVNIHSLHYWLKQFSIYLLATNLNHSSDKKTSLIVISSMFQMNTLEIEFCGRFFTCLCKNLWSNRTITQKIIGIS